MPSEASRYSADWLHIAERDLRRVELLLNAEDPEAAGFFDQQAVEKFPQSLSLVTGMAAPAHTRPRSPLEEGLDVSPYHRAIPCDLSTNYGLLCPRPLPIPYANRHNSRRG